MVSLRSMCQKIETSFEVRTAEAAVVFLSRPSIVHPGITQIVMVHSWIGGHDFALSHYAIHFSDGRIVGQSQELRTLAEGHLSQRLPQGRQLSFHTSKCIRFLRAALPNGALLLSWSFLSRLPSRQLPDSKRLIQSGLRYTFGGLPSHRTLQKGSTCKGDPS